MRKNRAYIAGLKKGISITPRKAYLKGYRSGKAREDARWTKKAAEQSHYYYNMGKGSRS